MMEPLSGFPNSSNLLRKIMKVRMMIQHVTRMLKGLLLPLLLGGCAGTSVEVPSTNFPIPLVDKLPLTIGAHLPEELITYTFVQDLGVDGDFEIDLGSAQQVVFLNLLVGMFDHVELISDPTHPTADVAGTLVPRIEEMQFSAPFQTKTDYYEVWIRYQIKLYSRDGDLLGEWPLTAYGKANTQNYGLNYTHPALEAAALQACRDAMAFFTVQFRTIPTVQNWLAGELLGGSS